MKRIREKFAEAVFLISALAAVAAVLLICVFLFANGVPAIGEIGLSEFLLGKTWRPTSGIFGIFPMIIGSIYVTGLALAMAVPIGICTAIFMARFCNDRLHSLIKPCVDLLAGIPSIVYGFFGLMVIVPFIRETFGGTGSSLLSASVILAIMILPTIIGVSETAIRAVPGNIYEGALAIGASHERSVFSVVVPAAKSGVVSSIILGVGRAVGETMAVVMVAGNQAVIPESVTSGVRTLTANIVMEMAYATDLHHDALIATGVVLFVFVLFINLVFSALKRRATA